ncbi:signal peptidase I [Rossellomorea aquimaris]|uniref:signal peptidase I n=1 Tax=Rossellomorea aquimaris TaxID=189382 RepID=UPI0005CA801E|nr:signal peptidase I [Rossellomorea aquimaris]
MRRKILHLHSSRRRLIILAGYLLFIYIFGNSSLPSQTIGSNHGLLEKVVLYGGLGLIVWWFPRERFKGKRRLTELINWWAFIFALIYVFVYFGAGVIDGFGKSPFDHSLKGIGKNLILLSVMIIGVESARSFIVNSRGIKENYLFFILLSIGLTIFELPLSQFTNLSGMENIVQFSAQSFAPEFSRNLFATYLVFLGGVLPAIIYLGVIELIYWISPILPNLKWITEGLVGTLIPIFSLMFFHNIYMKEAREARRRNREEKPLRLVITGVISIGVIWFSVGIFPVFPSVIATGSMQPIIDPGDVILVKKVDSKDVQVGEVIQFVEGDIKISHRVIDIIKKEGKTLYVTKGDNNSVKDSEPVHPEEIKGKIIYTVPKIGWPTLLIKSDDKVENERVEF